MSSFGNVSRRVAKLAALALVLLANARAHAQTPVEFGDTISSPGVYFLNGNQTGVGDGITIESDDVVLLLLRFTLRGQACDLGIDLNGYDNVTIIGGRITNFCIGIQMRDAEYCTVKDVRLDHHVESGIDAEGVRYSEFLRLKADHNNEWGVKAEGCDFNKFLSVRASDNTRDGILLGFDGNAFSADDNKVRLCWSAYNGWSGIHVVDSDRNHLIQNQCPDNGRAGILLGRQPFAAALVPNGANDNVVKKNWCVFNAEGIAADVGATGNEFTENTALANGDDLVDANPAPPCVNTWFLNTFFSFGGAGAICLF